MFDCTPWHKTVKYLGVWIQVPLTNEALIQLNVESYKALVKDIKRQLEGWCSLWLSWFGRMATLKIKVLPHLLFILRALILLLSRTSLNEIQRLFDEFAWGKKKRRILNTILQQAQSRGCLAYPNVVKYYQAPLMESLLQQGNGTTKGADKLESALARMGFNTGRPF